MEYVGKRYFRGRQDLVMLCIDSDRVTAPVKYEDLNGEGMLFPHIYGPINTDAVTNVVVALPSNRGRDFSDSE